MVVFDHLSFLEMFLMTVHKNGTPMPELYQMVQQAGNVLARLYLLITVGSVFIKSKKVGFLWSTRPPPVASLPRRLCLVCECGTW